MEFRHLRYFQAICEQLSFSKASHKLRIAQPALSRAVKEMESELGFDLLERTRHHVSITPAGRVMLEEASSLLERREEALHRVKRTASGEEGELRLGYVGPPTTLFLGRVLHAYRKRYPMVCIHLEERTPERVWEMVARGRLHIGITRPVPTSQDLGMRSIILRAERLGAVVRPDHRWADRRSLPWAALSEEPLIALTRREGASLHDTVLAGCRQAGFMPRLAQAPSLIGTVLAYVEAGAGVGIMTDSILDAGATLRFIPLTPIQTVPLVLVWQEDSYPPPVQRFRELLETTSLR